MGTGAEDKGLCHTGQCSPSPPTFSPLGSLLCSAALHTKALGSATVGGLQVVLPGFPPPGGGSCGRSDMAGKHWARLNQALKSLISFLLAIK